MSLRQGDGQGTPSTSRTPASALKTPPTPASALQTPSNSRTPASASSTSPIPATTLQSTTSTSFSKYLSPPQFQSTPSGKTKELPRARLLTSAKAVELMLEKERKKQEEAEVKERKKKEREEAKNRREAELKKRSEEHAKKAELKAKQKAQKEEEKTRKAKGRAASAGRKRAGDNERKRKPAKHPRKDHSSSSAFDQSECCICFVTYEDDQSGKDWVECACGRWLHEDCADDCFVDDEGKERLCLICLNQFCK